MVIAWDRLHDQVSAIGRDRAHGARELVLQAARAVAREMGAAGPGDDPEFRRRRRDLARRLLEAQPEMAPFHHLAALVLREGDEPGGLAAAADAFARHLGEDRTVERAVEELPIQGTVVTYSRSGSVLAALVGAGGRGKRLRVLLGEGRPRYEGRSLAVDLAATGLRIELFTDAGLLSRVGEADLVLLGADAIGERHFRNKVGSSALCALARDLDVPVRVLADPTKFLPEERWPESPGRPGGEVWADAPEPVTVRNPYFEAVRWTEGAVVISGDALLDPPAVAARVGRAGQRLRILRRLDAEPPA